MSIYAIYGYSWKNYETTSLVSKCPFLGVAALTHASFGQGTGRIWLDNVQCTGSQRALMDCAASSSGNDSCTHAQDAGVRCQSGVLQCIDV